jgi:radical SAM superfamily enzyme with C-terminal helix-hairpin-helix motif
MKSGNVAIIALANAMFLSLLSFPASADTSTPVTLEELVQLNVGKQLAAEGNKYTQIVSLAAGREDELTARRYEATHAYKKWSDLKSAVVKHYPSTQDYIAVEMASREYSRANKAFIDLQKSILAQNGVPVHNVATKIIALQ